MSMKADDILPWLVTLGVGGLVVELVRGAFQRRKMGADYANVIAKSAVGLLAPLEERAEQLQSKLDEAEAKVIELATALTAAHEEIRQLRREVETNRRKQEEEIASLRTDVAESRTEAQGHHETSVRWHDEQLRRENGDA